MAGLVQALVAHPRARLAEDRRRRVSIAVAVIAACCIPGLLLHGRWTWAAVEAAPAGLAQTTAALAGALAALCLAGAVTARTAPLRAGAAVWLVGGFAGFAAAVGSLSGGDADIDPLVLLANLIGGTLTVPLLLTGRRVILGRRPGRVRRAVLWTVAIIAVLLTSATQLMTGLNSYADRLIEPDAGLQGPMPSVLGTVLAALVLTAFLSRKRPTTS